MEGKIFPIVGVGASAGGLQALELFFGSVHSPSIFAFIVVVHQAANAHSHLAEIISRRTSMPVTNVVDGELIVANHVYIALPAHIINIRSGRFYLLQRSDDPLHKPIDVFMASLAADMGERAVGIILSGTGTDGTLGLKAIKERCGLTFAQGNNSSGPEYENMPKSAVAAGVVDLELPVEDMYPQLVRYAKVIDAQHSSSHRLSAPPDEADITDEQLQVIYALLLEQTGHNFSGYKTKTFTRRLARRVQVIGAKGAADYITSLQNSADELTLLFRDLLIGVTKFFRDHDAFDVLAKKVVPELFKKQNLQNAIRIWVPGCATGEEAYSIAIVVHEHMRDIEQRPRIQVFATDIDDNALNVARTGRYPAALLSHVSSERLDRYFTYDETSYVISKEIREMCIFSSHSVLRDPPFSKMDLISCRNLLIYLGTHFQEQVIPLFHFALRPKGYLFLGTSENVSRHSDLFVALDKRQRIFQRRDNIPAPLQFPLTNWHSRILTRMSPIQRDQENNVNNLRQSVEARVLERFAPAHVVINADGDILHYSARTGKYLEPAAGLPDRQLLSMARRGLRVELRAILRQAIQSKRTVVREDVSVELEDHIQRIDVTVEPLTENENDHDPLFLVVFNDRGRSSHLDKQSASSDVHDHCERELREARDRIQSTVEEYETALEELKSSNEELQSINEELQSSNEELETSKEELQSLNEELHAVNATLSSKIDELDRSNDDLRNVFESTQVGTIFLDEKLLIRTFTPAISGIFNLIPSDRGRPLTDIVSRIDNPMLATEVKLVLENNQSIEKNVRSLDGNEHYLMRILPYHDTSSQVEGVLVTFFDITRLIEAEAQQRTLVEELNHRVRNMLMVVNAVAQLTMRSSPTKEAFAEAFMGRIRGMSNAYSLVSNECWGNVALREIVASNLTAYITDDQNRILIQGDSVLCKPNAALALSMVIHELTTNAIKYGALSSASGRIEITWTIDDNQPSTLTLAWREKDGPAVKQPQRNGFGTELVQRELQHSLDGKVTFNFLTTGMEVLAILPLHARNFIVTPSHRGP